MLIAIIFCYLHQSHQFCSTKACNNTTVQFHLLQNQYRMELDNLSKQDAEQTPPLLDSFMEQVRDTKVEINKVANRASLVRGFYRHIRNSNDINIRRDLEDKVNGEIELVSASLSKITDSLIRWKSVIESSSGVVKLQRTDAEKGVRSHFKQVLTEFEETLTQHRNISLEELQRKLKETSSVHSLEKSSVTSIKELRHIEIEARYGELLRTDRHLRYLKIKFSQYLSSEEYTDLAVLHLSKMMDKESQMEQSRTQSGHKLLLLLASLTSLSLVLIIFLLLM